jgi:hypothetical protein
MNARITNVDRVVTADCTETDSYRNVSRPNEQATLQDSEFLELTFGDRILDRILNPNFGGPD